MIVKGIPKFLQVCHFKHLFSFPFLYIYNILYTKSFKSIEEGEQINSFEFCNSRRLGITKCWVQAWQQGTFVDMLTMGRRDGCDGMEITWHSQPEELGTSRKIPTQSNPVKYQAVQHNVIPVWQLPECTNVLGPDKHWERVKFYLFFLYYTLGSGRYGTVS